MAIQQTRYTYPSVKSSSLRLFFDIMSKFVGDGQIRMAGNTYVEVWRYVGNSLGHRNMDDFNPANGAWDNAVPRLNLMRMKGWEYVEVISGVQYDTVRNAIYVDLDTTDTRYSKPGLYMDAWYVEDYTTGEFLGPTQQYFRLESRLLAPSSVPIQHWFGTKIFPGGIPFKDVADNAEFPLAIGLIPIVNNIPDQSAYQGIRSMISSAWMAITEIWFYEHEISGRLDPPELVFAGSIPFHDQMLNVFYGNIDPGLFAEPGLYRIKIRVTFADPSQTSLNHGMGYQDFWKPFYVGRENSEIDGTMATCWPGIGEVPATTDMCSLVVALDDSLSSLTRIGETSVGGFHERERLLPTTTPNPTEYRTFNAPQVYFSMLGGFADDHNFVVDLPSGVSIDSMFPPMFLYNRISVIPELPFDGRFSSYIGGSKYDLQGARVTTETTSGTSSQKRLFAAVLADSNWSGATPLGTVKAKSFNYTQATDTGTFYEFDTNTDGASTTFVVAFIANTNYVVSALSGRYVLNFSEVEFSPKFRVLKSTVDSLITAQGGLRKFRVRFVYAKSGTTEQRLESNPSRIACDTFHTHSSIFRLSRVPDTEKFPIIAFRGNYPAFPGHDYTLSEGNTVITPLFTGTTGVPFIVYYGAKK